MAMFQVHLRQIKTSDVCRRSSRRKRRNEVRILNSIESCPIYENILGIQCNESKLCSLKVQCTFNLFSNLENRFSRSPIDA